MPFDYSSISEIIQQKAAENPKRHVCYERLNNGTWQGVTWESFYQDIQAAAHGLRKLGIRKGDRVAILGNTCRTWQTAEIGAWMLGAVVVGVDPHGTSEYMEHVLSVSDAEILIADSAENLSKVPAQTRRAVGAVLMFDELSNDPIRKPFLDSPMIMPDDPALLFFTSGTTGTPKGIQYTHRQFMAALDAITNVFPDPRKNESLLSWLPMAHLFQQIMNLLSLGMGIRIYFSEDPREIMTVIREVRPTIFIGVPRFYEKVYEGIQEKLHGLPRYLRRAMQKSLSFAAETRTMMRDREPISLKRRIKARVLDLLFVRRIRRIMGGRIRFMFTGTAPLSVHVMTFFHDIGITLLEAYGLSENTIPVAANLPQHCRFGSVGRPLPQNTVQLASDGEILVKGPGVFDGYLGTSRQDFFTPDGFYQTGDFGCMDEDGFLYLRGRKSEIIKTSTGRRISPVKIELIFRESPHIDQIVVVGDGRKHLSALILSKEDSSTSIHVRQHIQREIDRLNTRLAPHEQIQKFELLPQALSIQDGELTTSLKIRRAVVEKKYAYLIDSMYEPRFTTSLKICLQAAGS